MKARLFARFGPEAGLEVEFGGEATIGRSRESSVLLSSREVSQQHARVFFDADSAAYWVEDLDSLNGTRLDGEPVSGRERLSGLHVLTLGASAELFFLELDLTPEVPPTEATPAAAAETSGEKTGVESESPTLPVGVGAPAKEKKTKVDSEMPTLPVGLRAKKAGKAGAAKSGAATRVEASPAELPPSLAQGEAPPEPAAAGFLLDVSGDTGGRFELRQGENMVGRSGRADVVLRHRELSRRHATLRVDGSRVWLRDEGSRNKTFVGGEQITDEVEIEAGSELRFGRLEARLMAAGAARGEPAGEPPE